MFKNAKSKNACYAKIKDMQYHGSKDIQHIDMRIRTGFKESSSYVQERP